MVRHMFRTGMGLVLSGMLLVFAGCGMSGTKVCNLSGNCCPPNALCVIGPGPEFLYATSGTGQVLGFTVDSKSGALSAPTSAAGPVMSLGIAAAGSQFLYVSDFTTSELSGYSINPSSGVLSAITGSPFSTGQLSLPTALATSFPGNDLYVMDVERVDGYNTGSTGVPVAIAGSPFPSGASFAAVVTPSGQFLFATDFDPPSGVRAFTIDSAGGLTAVPGSPFPIPGQTVANSQPFGITTDPSGLYVYATLNASNQVAAFSVDQTTGILTAVPGSPFDAGLLPTELVVAGNFLYAVNAGDQTISAFTVNLSNGALAPVSGSPFAAPGVTAGVVADSLARHLYVGAPSLGIVAFSIGADGSLTAVAGSPFPATGAALLTMVKIPGTGG